MGRNARKRAEAHEAAHPHGVKPSAEGPVGSGLVAMKRAPLTISRIACVMRPKL